MHITRSYSLQSSERLPAAQVGKGADAAGLPKELRSGTRGKSIKVRMSSATANTAGGK
jgi:hypothetical protein